MNLNHLKYFVEVANSKSISLASKTLFISQPALSRAIHTLERELGGELFSRNSEGAQLTEFGEYLINDVQLLLEGFDQLFTKSQQFLTNNQFSDLQGTFNIYTMPSIADCILPTITEQLPPIFSGIDFHVNLLNIDVIPPASFVISPSADFIIAMNPNNFLNQFFDTLRTQGQLQSESLFTENLLAVVSKQHPLAAKKSITLNALSQYKLIAHQNGFSQKEFLEATFEKPIELLFESNNAHTITQILLKKDTVLLTNTPMYCRDYQSNENLKAITIRDHVASYVCLYQPQHPFQPLITELIRLLKKH